MRTRKLICVIVWLLSLTILSACVGGNSQLTPTRTPTSAQATRASGKAVTDIVIAEPSPTTPTPTPLPILPTSTALPVSRLELLSHRTYLDRIGSLWVVGEAKNVGDTTASNIEVKMILVGADNKPLTSTYATLYLPRIAPGATMPFRGMFPQPPKDYKNLVFDLTTSPIEPTATVTSDFLPGLKLVSSEIKAGSNGTIITGTVRNEGSSTAVSVRVMGLLRDANGKTLDVTDGYARLIELGPGQESPFSVQFLDASVGGAYDLFFQGRTRPEPLASPTKVTSPTASR